MGCEINFTLTHIENFSKVIALYARVKLYNGDMLDGKVRHISG